MNRSLSTDSELISVNAESPKEDDALWPRFRRSEGVDNCAQVALEVGRASAPGQQHHSGGQLRTTRLSNGSGRLQPDIIKHDRTDRTAVELEAELNQFCQIHGPIRGCDVS